MPVNRGGVENTRFEAKDTQKKSEAKESPTEDRPSRGQGQECSEAKDTSASALQKKKEKVSTNFFMRCPK